MDRARLALLLALLAAVNVSAQSPARDVWQELQAKRTALSAHHQEFRQGSGVPTYVIIDAEGNFDTAVEGDRGFDGCGRG